MFSDEACETTKKIIDWIKATSQGSKEVLDAVDKNTDLLTDDILDSLGFVELLLFIEQATGRQIDLMELDPDNFGTVAGLLHQVVDNKSS